jgi:enamine deaminase RidA (YjgF/YER057c/UK114 family)
LPVIIKEDKADKEMTQVLPILKDPPAAIVADAGRLTFSVSPLTAKGLLSSQTREALKWITQNSRGGTVVKLRAFVAGTGDVRRVQEIVSDVFVEKRLPLPALSVAQVGALPLEGAQVVIEATLSDKKVVNPAGLAFVSGQRSAAAEPLAALDASLRASNIPGSAVKRVTCYLTTLNDLEPLRQKIAQEFPNAVATYVQIMRASLEEYVACEGVAALAKAPAQPVEFAGKGENGYSEVALIAPGRVTLTGTQMAFNAEDADLRLAFERLGKTLEAAGSSPKGIAFAHVYSILRTTGDRVGKMRYDFHGAAATPAGTSLMFEGLPGLEASFAIDVIALQSGK